MLISTFISTYTIYIFITSIVINSVIVKNVKKSYKNNLLRLKNALLKKYSC